MKSYAIVNMGVSDPQLLAEYGHGMERLLAKHGARYLVRGGAARCVEGEWAPKRIVVIEYPSPEVHATVVASEEYKALAQLRARFARCNIIEVTGV